MAGYAGLAATLLAAFPTGLAAPQQQQFTEGRARYRSFIRDKRASFAINRGACEAALLAASGLRAVRE